HRRADQEVPEEIDRLRRFAARREPVPERARVDRGAVEVERPDPPRGKTRAQTIREAEMREAEEARREVRGARQRVTAKASPRSARRRDRNVEPALQGHPVGDAEALEERAVLGAAA